MQRVPMIQKRARAIGGIALAIALATTTAGALMSLTAVSTSPASAQAAGGNGGQGGRGGGDNGGNGGGGNGTPGEQRWLRTDTGKDQQRCDGNLPAGERQKCRPGDRKPARVVSIYGFSNCAVVAQKPSTNSIPGEFYCLRPL